MLYVLLYALEGYVVCYVALWPLRSRSLLMYVVCVCVFLSVLKYFFVYVCIGVFVCGACVF